MLRMMIVLVTVSVDFLFLILMTFQKIELLLSIGEHGNFPSTTAAFRLLLALLVLPAHFLLIA
jgi:hypothetical protein